MLLNSLFNRTGFELLHFNREVQSGPVEYMSKNKTKQTKKLGFIFWGRMVRVEEN